MQHSPSQEDFGGTPRTSARTPEVEHPPRFLTPPPSLNIAAPPPAHSLIHHQSSATSEPDWGQHLHNAASGSSSQNVSPPRSPKSRSTSPGPTVGALDGARRGADSLPIVDMHVTTWGERVPSNWLPVRVYLPGQRKWVEHAPRGPRLYYEKLTANRQPLTSVALVNKGHGETPPRGFHAASNVPSKALHQVEIPVDNTNSQVAGLAPGGSAASRVVLYFSRGEGPPIVDIFFVPTSAISTMTSSGEGGGTPGETTEPHFSSSPCVVDRSPLNFPVEIVSGNTRRSTPASLLFSSSDTIVNTIYSSLTLCVCHDLRDLHAVLGASSRQDEQQQYDNHNSATNIMNVSESRTIPSPSGSESSLPQLLLLPPQSATTKRDENGESDVGSTARSSSNANHNQQPHTPTLPPPTNGLSGKRRGSFLLSVATAPLFRSRAIRRTSSTSTISSNTNHANAQFLNAPPGSRRSGELPPISSLAATTSATNATTSSRRASVSLTGVLRHRGSVSGGTTAESTDLSALLSPTGTLPQEETSEPRLVRAFKRAMRRVGVGNEEVTAAMSLSFDPEVAGMLCEDPAARVSAVNLMRKMQAGPTSRDRARGAREALRAVLATPPDGAPKELGSSQLTIWDLFVHHAAHGGEQGGAILGHARAARLAIAVATHVGAKGVHPVTLHHALTEVLRASLSYPQPSSLGNFPPELGGRKAGGGGDSLVGSTSTSTTTTTTTTVVEEEEEGEADVAEELQELERERIFARPSAKATALLFGPLVARAARDAKAWDRASLTPSSGPSQAALEAVDALASRVSALGEAVLSSSSRSLALHHTLELHALVARLPGLGETSSSRARDLALALAWICAHWTSKGATSPEARTVIEMLTDLLLQCGKGAGGAGGGEFNESYAFGYLVRRLAFPIAFHGVAVTLGGDEAYLALVAQLWRLYRRHLKLEMGVLFACVLLPSLHHSSSSHPEGRLRRESWLEHTIYLLESDRACLIEILINFELDAPSAMFLPSRAFNPRFSGRRRSPEEDFERAVDDAEDDDEENGAYDEERTSGGCRELIDSLVAVVERHGRRRRRGARVKPRGKRNVPPDLAEEEERLEREDQAVRSRAAGALVMCMRQFVDYAGMLEMRRGSVARRVVSLEGGTSAETQNREDTGNEDVEEDEEENENSISHSPMQRRKAEERRHRAALGKAFAISRETGTRAAIDYLVASGALEDTPAAVARLLRMHHDEFGERAIGDYLGEGGRTAPEQLFMASLRDCFFKSLFATSSLAAGTNPHGSGRNLMGISTTSSLSSASSSIISSPPPPPPATSISSSINDAANDESMMMIQAFDRSLRRFLVHGGFRLPGESQKVERLLEAFARRFVKDNPDFGSVDAALILAFSVVMLNTDIHNHAVKRHQKMKREEFIRNLAGVDEGKDFPRPALEELYDSIVRNEIRMVTGEDASSGKHVKKDAQVGARREADVGENEEGEEEVGREDAGGEGTEEEEVEEGDGGEEEGAGASTDDVQHHQRHSPRGVAGARGEMEESIFRARLRESVGRGAETLAALSSTFPEWRPAMDESEAGGGAIPTVGASTRSLRLAIERVSPAVFGFIGATLEKDAGSPEMVAHALEALEYAITACLLLNGLRAEKRAFASLLARLVYIHCRSASSESVLRGDHLAQQWFQDLMAFPSNLASPISSKEARREAVGALVAQVHSLASEVAETVAARASYRHLLQISERMGMPEFALAPNRVFLRETIARANTADWGSGAQDARVGASTKRRSASAIPPLRSFTLLLFSDAMVVTSPVLGGNGEEEFRRGGLPRLRVEFILPIRSLRCGPREGGIALEYEVRSPAVTAPLIFLAESERERDEWVRDVRRQIAETANESQSLARSSVALSPGRLSPQNSNNHVGAPDLDREGIPTATMVPPVVVSSSSSSSNKIVRNAGAQKSLNQMTELLPASRENGSTLPVITREQFNLAVKKAKSALTDPGVATEVKLLLYGYFKQATLGDCVTDDAPEDQIHRAKWHAWRAHKGLSVDKAKAEFIRVLAECTPRMTNTSVP